MVRKLVSLAVAAALFGFVREASAQYAPPQQYPPPPQQYAPPPQQYAPPPAPPGYGAPAYGAPSYGAPAYGNPGYEAPRPAAGPNGAGGSIGGLLGFGIGTADYGGGVVGFGFGAEGGYTLPMHLFVGGLLGYHAGAFGVFIFEPEVGYDLAINHKMMIRPFAGLGYADVIYSVPGCVPNDFVSCSGGSGAFVVTPGAMFAYFLTPHIYVGGELRINLLLTGASEGLIDIFGTGGYKF